MKLLFVHQHLGEFAGAEANIHLVARELRGRGHSLALLYERNTGRNEGDWHEFFPQSYRLPSRGNVEFLEAVLEQSAPDLIYLHNCSDPDLMEALFRAEAPVVRMVHDHSLYCLRTYKYNYFTRRPCQRPASLYCVFPCLANVARSRAGRLPIQWASYAAKRREIRLNQRAQRLIVYSDYLKTELVRNGFDPARIEICVPIVGADRAKVTAGFGPENLVLYAGQLIRGKGVDVLLGALAKVRVPFRCLILGDGNHRPYCERLAVRLGLAERVQFAGYVLPAELEAYYRRASVFAMSSLWPEPFGMAGPEAMRYGLPVVAFEAGGIREWLDDGLNGYLVPWKDTGQFAARLEHLLLNKDFARQMGRRAAESVSRFEVSRQVARLEAVFQAVLAEARGPVRPERTPSPEFSAHE